MDEPILWGVRVSGLPVVDVNGARLGTVVALEPEGRVLDVELSPSAAHRYRADRGVLQVPVGEVVDVDDHAVTLREEGAFLVHPDLTPSSPPGE
jgi:hypothetical protein